MAAISTQDFTVPSAVLWDGGAVLVPLFAVSDLSLSESYHLPPLGSSGARAIAPVSDTTMRLSGLLVGESRYALKLALENLAESAQRGSVLGSWADAAGLPVGGLTIITSMTIRTDMQVKELSFSETAQRRQVLSVTMALDHVPRPSPIAKLLDIASLGVGALMDATA